MAISINHTTYVITIPKVDTTFVGTNAETGYEIRSYNEYQFMRDIQDYLDDTLGASLPDAIYHETVSTISGIVYARKIRILAPYTITFENGVYQVVLNGGTNNNILDVLNPNSVSVISNNSAGKQVITSNGVGTPTEVADAVWDAAMINYLNTGSTGEKLNSAGNSGDPWTADLSTYGAGTAGKAVNDMKTGVDFSAAKLILIEKILRNKSITDPATGLMTVYDDNGTSILLQANVFEDAAGSQAYRSQGIERRERLA